MPPVFGPVSPSPTRLWSCEVAIGSAVLPSTIEMKLASSPSRNSSITTRAPAVAEGVAGEHVAHRGLGFGQRHRDDHALAGGQAIGLDHDRRAFFADVGQRRIDIGMHGVVRGRDAVAREEFLGEGLAAFELRRGGGRPEDAQALGAEAVDYAGDQRCSGPTTVKATPSRLASASRPSMSVAADRDVAAFVFASPCRRCRARPSLRRRAATARASRPVRVRGRRNR